VEALQQISQENCFLLFSYQVLQKSDLVTAFHPPDIYQSLICPALNTVQHEMAIHFKSSLHD